MVGVAGKSTLYLVRCTHCQFACLLLLLHFFLFVFLWPCCHLVLWQLLNKFKCIIQRKICCGKQNEAKAVGVMRLNASRALSLPLSP